jgi:hypothetical protein
MMDEVTYEVARRKNVGWMSEAHRLSLGANRSRKWPAVAGNASRLSQIALVTCPHAKIAPDSILQSVGRWLLTHRIPMRDSAQSSRASAHQ